MDNDTIIIRDIPVSFDLDAISKRLEIQSNQKALRMRLEELAVIAAAIAKPRAVTLLRSLEVLNDEQVAVGGVTLTSALLREKMGELGRVFPYMATEGRELADWAQALTDPTDLTIVFQLRQAAVKQYEAKLETSIMEKFGIKMVSAMNPGSLAAWPISQQEQVFRIMAPYPQEFDIRLTAEKFMDPSYSLSGIFFQTDTKYYNCQLCPRQGCPNRKAPSTVI